MENHVFFLVLFATIMHAIWNGMVKNHSDKAVAISGIVFGRLPLSIIAIILLPLPSVESIPYMMVSVIIHQGYQWFLLSSYEIGDLTKVYPVARGTGPLVATIISIIIYRQVRISKLIIKLLHKSSIFLNKYEHKYRMTATTGKICWKTSPECK